MSKDTSMRIKKEVKEKLVKLPIAGRLKEGDIVLELIKFYENHMGCKRK